MLREKISARPGSIGISIWILCRKSQEERGARRRMELRYFIGAVALNGFVLRVVCGAKKNELKWKIHNPHTTQNQVHSPHHSGKMALGAGTADWPCCLMANKNTEIIWL